MRNIWTIARREIRSYFSSPIAYAIAFAILLISGILFYANIINATMQQYTPGVEIVLGPLTTLLLFSTPAITMRLMAEEQKSGTLELLLTAPVREWEVVIGKWVGASAFILVILAATLVFPLMLNQIVQPGIDQGVMMASYLGLFLMISGFMAIGVMISSFFANQIAAFFATFGVVLALWVIGYPAQMMTGTAGEIVRYLDISTHYYDTFFTGVIELKSIIFFLSIIAVSLFIGSVTTEARRWR